MTQTQENPSEEEIPFEELNTDLTEDEVSEDAQAAIEAINASS